jgi:hypothetical protein
MSDGSGDTNKKRCKGGDLMQLVTPFSQIATAGLLLAPGLEDDIADQVADSSIACSSFLWALGADVEPAKRDMHGLLNRIFAAFDGAKFVESPTLARR